MASSGSGGFAGNTGSGSDYNQRARDYNFVCRIPCPPSQCTSCYGAGYHPPPPRIQHEDWTHRPRRRQVYMGAIHSAPTPFTEDLPPVPPLRASPPRPTNRGGRGSQSTHRGGRGGHRGGSRGGGRGLRGGYFHQQDQRFQQEQEQDDQHFQQAQNPFVGNLQTSTQEGVQQQAQNRFVGNPPTSTQEGVQQQAQDPFVGNLPTSTQEGVQQQASTDKDKQKLQRQNSFPPRDLNWKEVLQAPEGMPRGGSSHRGGGRGGYRGQRGGRGGHRSAGKLRHPQTPHPELLAKHGLPQDDPLFGYYGGDSDDESVSCETPSPGARPSDRGSQPRRPPAPAAMVANPRQQGNQPHRFEVERHERQGSLVGALGPHQYPPANVYQRPLPAYMRRPQPWALPYSAHGSFQPSFSMADLSAALPPISHRYNHLIPPPRPVFYPTDHAQMYNPYVFPSFGHGPHYAMAPTFEDSYHHPPSRIPRPVWDPYGRPFPNQMAPENTYGYPPEYFIPSPAGSPLPGSISMPALRTSDKTTIIENGAPKDVPTALRQVENPNPDLAIVDQEYPHAYWCGRYSSGMDRWCEKNPQLSEEERSDAVLKALEESCETQGAKNSYWRWRRLLEWRWGQDVAGRGQRGDWDGDEDEDGDGRRY